MNIHECWVGGGTVSFSLLPGDPIFPKTKPDPLTWLKNKIETPIPYPVCHLSATSLYALSSVSCPSALPPSPAGHCPHWQALSQAQTEQPLLSAQAPWRPCGIFSLKILKLLQETRREQEQQKHEVSLTYKACYSDAYQRHALWSQNAPLFLEANIVEFMEIVASLVLKGCIYHVSNSVTKIIPSKSWILL
jgi:hypothetical protein